uniref:Phenoloxidase-activating factor 2 n=1 Tax=Culex tarsalis TaxID=7177 RepID=A0A1Q3FRB4_CULTA
MITSISLNKTFLLLFVALEVLIVGVDGKCDGVCVPLNECADDHFGGENWFDIRVGGDEEVEADCEQYLRVCCKNVIPPGTEGFTIRPTTGTNAGQEPKVFNDCGTRNMDGAGFRISHATQGETEFGEFPWMVALYASGSYICGGSLIKPNVVVTAGHCVFNKQNAGLVVRAGEWDSKTTDELLAFQEQRVTRVIMHDQYNTKFLFNDIALLVLEKPFQPDEHIQLLCLAPQGKSFDNEESCIATGWGKERFDSSSYQNILKKVELPVMPHGDCQEAFRKTRLGPTFQLHRSMLCAGGEEGVDTCTGDGGSPLACPSVENGNRYQLAGIVAWGIGCGQAGVPGAYARASLYTTWIERNVEQIMNDLNDYYGE